MFQWRWRKEIATPARLWRLPMGFICFASIMRRISLLRARFQSNRATARVQPAEPAFTLWGKHATVNPCDGRLFEITELCHVTIRNLTSRLMPLPDNRCVARLEPALAR